MPAVTPADVHTLPSRTKIGSASTVTSGILAREARRTTPSASSPAGRRAARPPRARTRRCTPTRPAGSRRASRAHAGDEARRRSRRRARLRRPTTTSVSIGAPHRAQRAVGDERRPAGRRARPRRRAPRPRPGTRRARGRSGARPRAAAVNTSCGPTRSRAMMPGIGDEHDAAAHPPIVRVPASGSNDQIRTIPAIAGRRYDPGRPWTSRSRPPRSSSAPSAATGSPPTCPGPRCPRATPARASPRTSSGSARCSTRGYAVVSWPREYGGREASLWEWLIFEEEYYAAGAPQRVTQNGIFLLAPTIFEFGTQEQKDRILPKMAVGRADVVPGVVGAERGQRPRRHPEQGRARRRRRRLAARRARRRGRHAARSARTSSGCSAPTPRPSATAASPTSSSTSRSPGVTVRGRSSASTATKASPRCSSTTCSCPTPTCSASRIRAGASRWRPPARSAGSRCAHPAASWPPRNA